MSKQPEEFRAQDYEAIIGRVRDVLAARVVVNKEGDPAEVHVLARLRRSAKQIVRDIESVLLTTFGCEIDSKKISVAQIRDDSESVFLPLRLVLDGIHVNTSSARSEVRITLRSGDRILEGTSEGTRSSHSRLRMVAEAAMAAISSYIGGQANLTVLDVATVCLGGQEVVLVSIAVGSQQHQWRETRLIGSAFVKTDDREAVARAALDALNRQMDYIVKGKGKDWAGDASVRSDPD